MRVVLVSGGVMAGVGKGGFLALLDVFPVVSLRSHSQNSTSHPPVRVILRVELLVQLDRSFWLAKSLTPPDFLDQHTDLGPFRHYRYGIL